MTLRDIANWVIGTLLVFVALAWCVVLIMDSISIPSTNPMI